MLEGADGAEFHIAGEQSGSGISEAGVSTPQSQETPDEGFWPSSANLSRRLAFVSPDGADLTTRSRQARRARTLAAPPPARVLGRGGGPRRRGEPGLALPLGEAARAALAKATPAGAATLGPRPHSPKHARE